MRALLDEIQPAHPGAFWPHLVHPLRRLGAAVQA
jgi:hypothetical protein